MRRCGFNDTGRTLVLSGQPLAVSCLRCPRRILLRPGQVDAHDEDIRPIYRLPLLCRCGSRDVERFILEAPEDITAFLGGATLERAGGHNSVMK